MCRWQREGVPDGNAIPIPKKQADEAMDSASCIGCGACVASCKNASAMLFVGAKVSQLALLPQGKPEAALRVQAMVAKMDELSFGNCTNTYACEAECPKEIKRSNAYSEDEPRVPLRQDLLWGVSQKACSFD